MLFVFALSLVLSVVSAQQYVSFPNRPPGFTFGNGSVRAPVQMDLFYDLECPDCLADLPILEELVGYYGPDKVRFSMHTFPLPYHGNAFLAAEAVHIVAGMKGIQTAIGLTKELFAKQNEWHSQSVTTLNHDEIVNLMSNYVAMFGVTKEQYMAAVKNRTYSTPTRTEWKYGCTRGVANTPTHFLNGIKVDGSMGMTASQWKTIIDGLLK